jgi:tape measure domain-containing protein
LNNEDLVLKMILDESGFSAGLDGAVKRLNKFDGQVENTGQKGGRSLGNIWTSFVGNFLASGASKIISSGIGLITDNLDSAINRVDTLKNSNRVFENMGFEAGETKKAMKNLEKSISGLPTPLDTAVKGMTALTATYDDIDLGQKVFAGLNNAILGFGGTTEMVDNAIMQLSQLPMDGPLDAQTWNSLRNSGLTPVLNAMAKESGTSMSAMKEAFGSGELTVEDFTQKLMDMNKNGGGGLKSLEKIAKDSTDGIKTGIANAKTAAVRGVANIIKKVNEGLQDAGFGSIAEIIAEKGAALEKGLTKFADAIPGLIKGAKELYDTIEPFIPAIMGLTGYLITFTAVLKIQDTISSITQAFKNWGKATEGVTLDQRILNGVMKANWVTILVSAIIVLVGYIIYLWNTNEDFRNAVIKIWDGIKKAFSDAADWAVNAWESTIEFFKGLWAGLKEGASNAIEGIKNAWNGVGDWFTGIWQGMKDGVSGFWQGIKDGAQKSVDNLKESWSNVKKWFGDTWQGIKDTVTKIAGDLVKGVMDRIGPLIYGIRNSFIHISLFLKTLWTNLVTIGKNLFTILKNVILAPMLFVTSLISGGWEEAKDNMIAVWNNITEAAGEIWESITNIISSYLENIKMVALNLWTGLKMSLSNLWNEISTIANDVWTAVSDFFSVMWKGIVDGTIESWNNLKTSVVETWENMKQSAIDTFNAVVNFFKDSWKSIKQNTVDTWDNIKKSTVDGWNSIKEFLSGLWDGIVNGAKEAWENLKKSVSDTVDNVANVFDELKEIDLLEIGGNIVQGLIDGIAEKWDALKQSVKDMAGGIKDWISDALDIHSPSRWMRDMVGKNIVLGVVRGIEEEQTTLDNAVRKMADLPTETTPIQVNSQLDSSTTNPNIASINPRENQKTFEGDTFNIQLQAFGDLPEAQMMQMTQKFVKYINDVKSRDYAPKGGAFNGI